MEWTEEHDAYLKQCVGQIAAQMQRPESDIVRRISSLYAAPREGGGKWTKEEEDMARTYFDFKEESADAFWEKYFKGKRSASAMKTYIETYVAPLRGQKTEVPSAVRLLKAKLLSMAKDETEKSNVDAYCMQIAEFLISGDAVQPKKRQRKTQDVVEEEEKMEVGKDSSVFFI